MTASEPRPLWRDLLAIAMLRPVPFWQRSWKRRVGRLLLIPTYLYVAAMVALLLFEDRMLYPGATVARPWREPPDELQVRELTLSSAAGDRIHAWFTVPTGWKPSDGAVHYSHGNRANVSRLAARAQTWREPLGRAVLLYDYPGYGKSSGRPTEAGCYSAGEAAFGWLVDEAKVAAREVLLVGESLGCAIATELATRHDARLLVLQGGFTSFPDMAQHRFPMFPGRWLVHNKLDNESKLPCVRCPVLVTHGTADSVVPFHQGERNYAAAREPKRFWRKDGGGHGAPSEPEFFREVQEFLKETGS